MWLLWVIAGKLAAVLGLVAWWTRDWPDPQGREHPAGRVAPRLK